ncbi:hypothetical protein LIER_14766 [Lithospermum erythrorhizon]|uniref:DUF4283 domain-containing protein n=1 Tax=Lithospermum erythrorhizon TaxID=34254 RepID=A0AAV3Q0F8_LITER
MSYWALEDLSDDIVGCELSVCVKVHSDKNGFVSTQGFNLAMSKAWNCKGIRVQGSILQVFFLSENDKARVMNQGPWCFDNRGMKEEFFTKEVSGKVGDSFMGSDAVELRVDKQGNKFFRLCAKVMINAPLRRLVTLKKKR